MHKAKAIIDAFTSALTTANITAFQSRVRSIESSNTPCVIVMMGSEERIEQMYFVHCQLAINLTLKVTAAETNLDAQLLLLRGQVESQIYISSDFGLNFVIDTQLNDVSTPEIQSDGDIPIAILTMSYIVNYRYPPNNPLI